MKKILVTGGLGYIGSHTVVELQNAGYKVVIVDNLSNSSLEVLEGITEITNEPPLFERLDLRIKSDVSNFFKRHNDIQGIIHFAASKAVGESVENPLLYYENNLNTLIYLLQECNTHGIENFIFSAHCCVDPRMVNSIVCTCRCARQPAERRMNMIGRYCIALSSGSKINTIKSSNGISVGTADVIVGHNIVVGIP